jgi:hypothetical protein
MRDSTEYRPLHLSMTRHRKTRRLARLLGVPEWQAMGLVTSIWCEVLPLEPDGVLEGWADEDLADAIPGYQDSATTLIECLVTAGWCDRREDGVLVIHEAAEYADAMRKAEQREKARAKKRLQREGTSRDMSPKIGDTKGTSGDMSLREGDIEGTKVPIGEDRIGEDRRGSKSGAEAPQAGTAKKAKAKKRGPADFNGLLESPYEGHARAIDYFRENFPAYDGQHGRPSLKLKLAVLGEWFVSKASAAQQWTSPLGIHNALARDYGPARVSYEQDQRKPGQQRPLTLAEVLNG